MYKSGKFTEEMVMEWLGTPAGNQDYAHARPFFEGKAKRRQTAARLTGNTSASHGFDTAAAAEELREIKDAMMGAIKEAVEEAVAKQGNGAESAAAVSQIRGENESLREKLTEMSRKMDSLTAQINNLKNALANVKANAPSGDDGNDDADKGTRNGGPTKRSRGGGDKKPDYGEYTPGMAWNSSWGKGKLAWWRYKASKDETNKANFVAYEECRCKKILEAARA